MRKKLMRGKRCLPLGPTDLNTWWGFGRGRNYLHAAIALREDITNVYKYIKGKCKGNRARLFPVSPVTENEVTFRSHLDVVLGSLHWATFQSMKLDQVISMHPFHPQPFCDSMKRQQIPVLPGSSNRNGGEWKDEWKDNIFLIWNVPVSPKVSTGPSHRAVARKGFLLFYTCPWTLDSKSKHIAGQGFSLIGLSGLQQGKLL